MLRWVRDLLRREQPPKIYALPTAEFHQLLGEHFCAQDMVLIERMVAGYYGGARVSVAFDPSAVQTAMSCAWSRTPEHGNCFTFPAFQPGHLLNTVVNRWLSLFELFLHFDQGGNSTGRIVLNFNDAGVEPGLAFCGDSSDHILIPDPDFFRTRGYARERDFFARDLPSWDERSATVLWRGSSLGQKHYPIAQMPRARLCQIAKAAGDGLFDVGIVDVLDVSAADAAELRAMDLIKDRVHWKEFAKYRFHIDIDGHANSFAGLMRKFLSGGLVLKVASPHQYAQWYYNRLKPWENFVPVRSDLCDLLEMAAYCRSHDDVAQRIAHNGRQLALSLTFESEFAAAAECVRAAFFRSGC